MPIKKKKEVSNKQGKIVILRFYVFQIPFIHPLSSS